MELSWTHDRRDGVDLIRCRLVNDAGVPRRVRLENRLGGPVLPPRRRGVPEQGWDADGVTVRLPPHSTRALGYACVVVESDQSQGSGQEAENAEPPVEIASVERAADGPPDGAVSGDPPHQVAGESAVRSAVRSLGDHRPPRAVVDAAGGGSGPAAVEEPPPEPAEAPPRDVDSAPDPSPTETVPNPSPADPVPDPSPAEPAAVDAWLDAVERRVERAERLDGADVEAATEVLVAAGGLDAVADLDRRLERDADRLRAVAERAASLAARTEDPTVPTGALERLS